MRLPLLILATVMSLAGTATLRAEDYPAKPVTLIVPFTPGGPADSAGRIIARALEHQSGRPFIVENIGGAGSTIGVTRAANATPDGYSLLLASSSALVMAPHLYTNLRYNPFTSLLPIGQITEAPFIVLVNSASKFRSYADLLDYGKANPGKMNFATPGLGTVQHVTIELMMDVGRFSATHVPFKGAAPTVTALLGGEVDFIVETPNSADALVAAGRLRPLAITGTRRLPQMPDTPTFQELGQKDVEMRSWFALIAPKGVPAPFGLVPAPFGSVPATFGSVRAPFIASTLGARSLTDSTRAPFASLAPGERRPHAARSGVGSEKALVSARAKIA